MNKYALKYTWNVEARKEGYTIEDVNNEDQGLADALLGISILLHDDGSYSQAIFSYNGKEDRDLTQKEIFKAWLVLGMSLHQQNQLKGWQKGFVKLHSDMLKDLYSRMNKD